MPKYLPHGSTVSIASITIGGLVSVGIPDRSRGEAETTDTDSGGDREYIPALREGGSVELTFRHIPTDVGQVKLETNFNAAGLAAVEEVIITLPDSGGRTYTFDGFVTAAPSGELALADDEAAQQSATIKVASAVTIVA